MSWISTNPDAHGAAMNTAQAEKLFLRALERDLKLPPTYYAELQSTKLSSGTGTWEEIVLVVSRTDHVNDCYSAMLSATLDRASVLFSSRPEVRPIWRGQVKRFDLRDPDGVEQIEQLLQTALEPSGEEHDRPRAVRRNRSLPR